MGLVLRHNRLEYQLASHLTVHFESILFIAIWFFMHSRVRMDEITNYLKQLG